MPTTINSILIAQCDRQNMDSIETFLEDHGPALSSTVAKHLVDTYGMTPAQARQRVSRAKHVRRLAGIAFPHRSKFLYQDRQFGSPRYWDNLAEALISSGSAYGYAINALRQREGMVPERHFAIVCGAPLRQKKHLAPETIFQRMSEAGILKRVTLPSIGECISLAMKDAEYSWNETEFRARLITEEILMSAVRDWLKKLGIASYHQVNTREDEDLPQVATFAWDMTAPSYLGHMVKKMQDGQVKPGFVACDVYLGHEVTEAGASPFVRKCVTLRSLQKVGPCMQIFVANKFSAAAFGLLKRHGIIPATPRSLFGEEVADGLVQLRSILSSAAESTVDPERFEALFSKLGKIEGAAIQLRGTLFEYLTAELFRQSARDVKMNYIFKPSGGKDTAEADVVAVYNDEIRVIECKGYSPRGTVSIDLFKRWLQINVPRCHKAISEHPDWRNRPVHFEFWCSGKLSEEALELFQSAKHKVKPSRYSLHLRIGTELHDAFQKNRDTGLLTAFERHFVSA